MFVSAFLLAMFSPSVTEVHGSADRTWTDVISGRRGLSDLTAEELRNLLIFNQKLRRPRLLPSETREECLEREQSNDPSHLESAIADLKCSQRR